MILADGRLERVVPIGMVDVGRAHLDMMFAGIADDLGRGIKPHGLGIQKRTGKDIRVMAFHPGRGVDQEREGSGMAFRETVIAEALDLAEAAFGEVGLIAARHHAGHEFLVERVDRAHAPEGGHGAPQAVGLGRGEAGGDFGDLHGLFLEQGHAKGAAQNLFQLLGDIIHRLLAIAAADIGVDHVALNGAGRTIATSITRS